VKLKNKLELSWAYFGGEPLGLPVLEILKENGLIPNLIVCNPDRKSGRKMLLTPPSVKEFAQKNSITVFQPESLKNKESLPLLTGKCWDLFVVVAYNHIIPKWLFELPKYKTLNLHPSLLPALRGPSPIRTAILEDRKEALGVTVILINEKLDSGPILGQEPVYINENDWPKSGIELDNILAKKGGDLLTRTIPRYLNGEIIPKNQDENFQSYTKKFTKEMGFLKIDPHNLPQGSEARDMFLKICAFEGFPGTFFIYNKKRVKVLEATVENNTLKPLLVLPEGKKEISFGDYLRSLKS
jgi:methionyl-tRNA formyltransferase